MSGAAAHCKRVGLRSAKQLAHFHGVTPWMVNYWHRVKPETFDRKLAEAAVALRNRRKQ